MTVTALPTPPSRADSANFAPRGDAFLGALPTFVTELNATAAAVTASQAAAASSASTAATSASASSSSATASAASAAGAVATVLAGVALAQANADAARAAAEASAIAAATYAGAVAWVSGTTYAIGDVRWSPINRLIYRRLTAGAGTTDPSLDATNWSVVVPSGFDSLTATTFFFATF